MAKSTGSGTSKMEGNACIPNISVASGFIGYILPEKDLLRLSSIQCPIFPGVRLAPISATDKGLKKTSKLDGAGMLHYTRYKFIKVAVLLCVLAL
jgi:hypothetical protein